MENVIMVDNVSKHFGSKRAVDQISMTVQKGEIYGLIGRNGAGKTTFMRLLLGMMTPTSGSVRLSGASGNAKIGSIIETPAFYDTLSAYKNLVYRAKLIGLKDYQGPIRKVLELMELWDEKDTKVKKYSLGMRQKLGIGAALLDEPDILILDEPINGLDPVAIAEVREILKKVNKENGTTILISSHILGEMEKLATKYGFIVKGKLVKELSEEEVKKKKIDLEAYSLEIMGGKING